MRAFLAVQLPDAVRQVLAALSGQLSERWRDGPVRWSKPENMHLTLRFLGDTPADRLEGLRRAVDEVAALAAPFELSLRRVGTFDGPRGPRVVWVGVRRPAAAALRSLRRDVDERLAGLGWPSEARSFSPHITLGRVRGGGAPGPAQGWHDVPPPTVSAPATELQLIESVLNRNGATYTCLHRASFTAAPSSSPFSSPCCPRP